MAWRGGTRELRRETAAAACIIYCYFCFVYLSLIIYIAPPAGANLFFKRGASAHEEGGEGREIVAAKSTRQRSVLFYCCCYILLGRETVPTKPSRQCSVLFQRLSRLPFEKS